MKLDKKSARVRFDLVRTAALLVAVVMSLLLSVARAQQPRVPTRVLVLYSSDKDFPFDVRFDRPIDVVVASGYVPLDFLLITFLLIERRRRQRTKAALDRLNIELEERVVERTSALAAKTRELETFAYSVAHDLKAPLRGIDGYSRLLLEDYMDKLDKDGREFLHTIRASTNEMSQLIEDLLAYSRVERQEMTFTHVELRSFIDCLVEAKRNELGARKVEFTVNVNSATVTADANGLAQALRNYLDNAVKFTTNTSEPHVDIGAEETETNCRLWVRDNGVGFDMKYHDKIFEIFTRLHHNEEYAGTGIGLAIARKAVERMKGRVWAESTPGMGATFYLEISKRAVAQMAHASDENHEP
jgi:light-regulated signal transduction histidine kinase (bacteriophytochrome)